jgi:hypothetical protein
VRHIPDGMLRRLDDEPLAVPDRVSDHVASCGRCRSRRAEIADDTELAAQLFGAPQLVPDVDHAWARLRRELDRSPAERPERRRPAFVAPRHARLPRVSLRAGLAIGAVGVLVAGTAAAASLTTVFSPTHVAPLAVSQSDMRAIAALTDLGNGHPLGGFATPTGSSRLRFGTITWSSGSAQSASSLAQANAEAGLAASLPAHRPAGVGAVRQFMVTPHMHATVTFDSGAAGLAGSSVAIDAGPAVLAQYGAAGGGSTPTLTVATMRVPTARSTGASLSQIEAFLLSRPGIPPALAEEVRLLGDLRTTLPVPVPPGASVRSVQVGGWPGILVADSSNAAAGVVWEDGRGLLHLVVGLLDSQDVLNVAKQLG